MSLFAAAYVNRLRAPTALGSLYLWERLNAHSLRSMRICELGVPVAAPFGGQIEDVPDRAEQVKAALVDVVGHARMAGIEVMDGAPVITREDGNRRVLFPIGVLTGQVILERAVAAAQQ